LSIRLYAISIEELLNKIRMKKEIVGNSYRSSKIHEINVRAYADDVNRITKDVKSALKEIQEYDEWGEISGDRINKTKTSIFKLNVDDIKAWNKNFRSNNRKNGVEIINIENCIIKLEKKLRIWNSKNEPFRESHSYKNIWISLIWFIANFINFEKIDIQKMITLIFNYLWNSKRELIKRGTMI